MKKTINLFLVITMLFVLSNCKKDSTNDNNNNPSTKVPVLTTTDITSIWHTTAMSGGTVTNDNGLTVTARGVCWSTTQNPTIASSKTTDGTGAGNFVSSITGLTPNTTYYARAYATNSAGTGYGSALTFTTQQYITDADGNIYNKVIIGTQVWMKENLKTTKYNDGTPIPLVTDNTEWTNLSTAGYCFYNNDADTYKSNYGALYNWNAVNTGKLCPVGWHIPSDAEWTILTDYLGGESLAGGKMKEAGTSHWDSPNTGATNESGLSILPGGYRYYSDGAFYSLGYFTYIWSSTENNSSIAWIRSIYYFNATAIQDHGSKSYGFSVRCVKD